MKNVIPCMMLMKAANDKTNEELDIDSDEEVDR
jgi:hypothetical protein